MTANRSTDINLEPNQAPAIAFVWIWIAYALAIAAAAATLLQPWVALGDSVLLRALVADIVATLIIFGFSSAFANASFYDAYWSVAPPLLGGYFLLAQEAAIEVRSVLVLSLVCAWAIRLTDNWARGWRGLTHEDWRYVDLQVTTGRAWWLVNLLGIHLFPTALVFIGCIGGAKPDAHRHYLRSDARRNVFVPQRCRVNVKRHPHSRSDHTLSTRRRVG